MTIDELEQIIDDKSMRLRELMKDMSDYLNGTNNIPRNEYAELDEEFEMTQEELVHLSSRLRVMWMIEELIADCR